MSNNDDLGTYVEEPYITAIDTTLLAIKNRIRKLNHKNPYTFKRITRRNPRSLKQAETIENHVKEQLNELETEDEEETKQEKTSQYYRILRELTDYIQPVQTIEDQLFDLKQNKQSLGVMGFQWDVDCQDTFMNQFTLIIAPSKSGKSFLINQLCYEIPHSFDKICFFMGLQSYKNKCPQILKHVANIAGIKTQWINTDKDKQPDFSSDEAACYEDLNDDGSSNFIYNDTTYPAIYIFDDLYTKKSDHWVVHFMKNMAIMSRHSKISCFVAFQGFTHLDNNFVDNVTKTFLFYSILDREDLWRKLKRNAAPSNLQEVLNDIKNGLNSRWYYLDDDRLVEYIPYEFVSKQQAVNKMKSKLPKGIIDEQKHKEVEEKNKMLRQLEDELGIKRKDISTSENKSVNKTKRLIDVKDAIEVKPKEYTQEFNQSEFKLIQKPKESIVNNTYNQNEFLQSKKQSRKGLRRRYGLV